MNGQQASVAESGYCVDVLEQIRNVTIVQHREPNGTVWGTSKRWMVKRTDRRGDWQRVARFPFVWPRDLFEWSRPTARAMRADKANVYVNREGAVLGVRGEAAYAVSAEGKLKRLVGIQGDCVLHRGICEDRQGWIYVGEYFMNPQRGPVRLWRFAPDLSRVEIAHEFPSGSIRHIHGIYRDSCDEDALWVTAGDYEGECYIFRTDDRFASLARFGDGTQTWRAVGLFFTPQHVCWLTDSHLEQNYACRMSRDEGRLERGERIECSGWYGTTTTDNLHVVFTTVERGPAIHRNQSSIFVSEDAFHWWEATCFEKDFWRPFQVFKYGVISCPSGPVSSSDFYISGEGLKGLDGTSLRLRIRKRNASTK